MKMYRLRSVKPSPDLFLMAENENELSFSLYPYVIKNGIRQIELPTDEEIGKGRDEHIPINEIDMWSERLYFTLGAKWLRDKIQGGNQ